MSYLFCQAFFTRQLCDTNGIVRKTINTDFMQSVARAVRRGNAIYYVDYVVRRIAFMWKKGSTAQEWRYAKQNEYKLT